MHTNTDILLNAQFVKRLRIVFRIIVFRLLAAL